MNKEELIEAVYASVSGKRKITKAVCKDVVEATFEQIAEAISTEPVRINGFGIFESRAYKENSGGFPSERRLRLVKFRASKTLREAVSK